MQRSVRISAALPPKEQSAACIDEEVAWEITGPGCWYISTPGYEDVCPVGLFVEA